MLLAHVTVLDLIYFVNAYLVCAICVL